MANTLALSPHLTPEQLRVEMTRADSARLRSRWQVVYLKALGKPTAEIAEATGYAPNWIRTLVKRYNEHAADGLRERRESNAGATPLLSAEQQADLGEALRGAAPDGGPWNGPKVAAWIAARTGREAVHHQRGWDYLRRLGFTAQTPRPRHRKAEAEAQATFKKS